VQYLIRLRNIIFKGFLSNLFMAFAGPFYKSWSSWSTDEIKQLLVALCGPCWYFCPYVSTSHFWFYYHKSGCRPRPSPGIVVAWNLVKISLKILFKRIFWVGVHRSVWGVNHPKEGGWNTRFLFKKGLRKAPMSCIIWSIFKLQ